MNQMPLLHRLISAGFAVCALASASVPALAWTVWPDVDFEWYANVGKPLAAADEPYPAPRAGYIWSPGHYENQDGRPVWVAGHWIKDDYAEQVAFFSHGRANLASSAPMGAPATGDTARESPFIESSRR